MSSNGGKEQQQQQQHVGVLAFPFGGHGASILTLVKRLAKASPGATFSFFSTAKSNASLFSSSSSSSSGMENVKAYDVSDGLPEGYFFSGNPVEPVNLFLNKAPENFRNGIEFAENDVGRKLSCVIADAFLWFSCEIAERWGVPWIALWTSGANSLSAHLHTNLIRQTFVDKDDDDDEKLTFIPGFSKLCVGDLPSGILSGDLNSPFSQMLHKMGEHLPRATAVVINSFEELDPEITEDLKGKFSRFLNIGPFNLVSPPPPPPSSSSSSSVGVVVDDDDEHGCIAWLEQREARSVAYIGFGTVATPPPHELKALAEALEETKTPFLWSLKDHLKCHLPQGFLERTKALGKTVPWAPQLQVLAHSATSVFITHCGWNSVIESIGASVPVIGRPILGDHQINAAMIERVWGTGVKIKGGVLTKAATMEALEMVLCSEQGFGMKKRVGALRELALKAVEPHGSSAANFAALSSLL